MNKIISRLLAVFLTLILMVSLLGVSGKVLERKSSINKNHDFLTQKQDFDVLFLGTSHVINGVYPMDLWREEGIASFNLGAHGSPIPSSYWILVNALDYTTPKVVVVDCMMLDRDITIPQKKNFLHQAYDAFPLSANKIRAIMDLTKDGHTDENGVYSSPKSLRMELLWDFSAYHSRWSTLDEFDIHPLLSQELGAESVVGIAVPDESASVAEGEYYKEDSKGVEYLHRIIDLCRSKNIHVVLTYMPAPAVGEDDILAARRAEMIAKEDGVTFLDLQSMDLIDPKTDSFDSNSHLNPSGARKVTKAIGRSLKETYDLPDRREDPAYADWNRLYEKYMGFVADNLKAHHELDNYLMLLADETVSSKIELVDESLLTDPKYAELFQNLQERDDSKGALDLDVQIMTKTDLPEEIQKFKITVTDRVTGEEIDIFEE